MQALASGLHKLSGIARITFQIPIRPTNLYIYELLYYTNDKWKRHLGCKPSNPSPPSPLPLTYTKQRTFSRTMKRHCASGRRVVIYIDPKNWQDSVETELSLSSIRSFPWTHAISPLRNVLYSCLCSSPCSLPFAPFAHPNGNRRKKMTARALTESITLHIRIHKYTIKS